jgi:predicted permease
LIGHINDDQSEVWMWVLIAGLLLVLMIAIFLIYRRMLRKEVHQQM